MHASIAFGWFLLIFIGHIEVMLYTPQRVGVLYYPVFFRYFVMKTNETLRGDFLFFLMDLSLLIVLSGVGIAIYIPFEVICRKFYCRNKRRKFPYNINQSNI